MVLLDTMDAHQTTITKIPTRLMRQYTSRPTPATPAGKCGECGRQVIYTPGHRC